MRKLAVVPVVAGLLVGGYALGGGDASGQGAEVRFERRAFEIVDREPAGAFHFLDEAPRARMKGGEPSYISAGDGFVVSKQVIEGRRRVGSVEERCIITSGARSLARVRSVCSAVLILRDGQIFVSLSPDFVGAERVGAVTGGTGAYTGATGTVSGREGQRATKVDLVLPAA